MFFLADLARALTVPCEVDFMAISHFAPDSGRVRIVKDLDGDIAGREVVVVEDVVDTGLTLSYLLGQLAARNPASLAVCALLDRARRRIVPLPTRYCGVAIDDEFMLGYGLDYGERYRNLPPSSSAICGSWNGIPTPTCRICTGRGRARVGSEPGWHC